MNVVLYYPRGYDATTSQRSISSLAVNLPPIGLASIAAVLRNAGHQVTIIDGTMIDKLSNKAIATKILAHSPDLVGFSTITSNFLDAYDVCDSVKKITSDVPTVFGGPHVSCGKGKLLEDYSSIDAIVAGEGELSMRALADGDPWNTIEGLFYRDGESIKHGPERMKMCVMDDLPFPAYDLIDGFPKKYAMALFSYPKHPSATVISSRGCVYRCSYCDRSVFEQSFRWNSPEYTVEQVQYLARDFGVKHVMFYDDLFTLNRARVAKLCGIMRASKHKVSFNCIVRIGHIDSELIRELKSAGCWMVHVGIESGDQNVLDGFKEGLRLEDIRRDVEKLHSEGLYVKGLFMMGFPGETEESIIKTMQFAQSLPLKDANITAFTPFPGAPITKGIEKKGTFNEDWSLMDCVNFVFVPYEVRSKEMLESYYKQFIQGFYNRPFMRKMYRKMMLQSPHSYWRLLKHAPYFLRYAKEIKE